MPQFMRFKTFFEQDASHSGCSEREYYAVDRLDEVTTLMRKNNPDMEDMVKNWYMADRAMYMSGRPHYKIWPELLDAFCRTALDVPAKYFRVPYVGFEIRVPVASDDWTHPLAGSCLYVVDQLELMRRACEQTREQTLLSLNAGREQSPYGEVIGSFKLMIKMPDPKNRTPDALFYHLTLPLYANGSVDSSLQLCAERDLGDGDEATLLLGLRLAVTMCFLITGSDKLIEPDVLSTDLQKFIEAKTVEEIERLHNKATRRRGDGIGYTVGRRERLLNIARQRNAEYEAGTGSPLKFQHQRAAHVHTYHTKTGTTMRWIPQLTVRPDLPPGDSGDGRGCLVR